MNEIQKSRPVENTGLDSVFSDDVSFQHSIPLASGARLRVTAVLEDAQKAIGNEWTNTLTEAVDLAAEEINQQFYEWAIEKEMAVLEKCISKRPSSQQFDKEMFVAIIRENMPHYWNIDMSEGSVLGDALQIIAESFQEASGELQV